MKTLRLYLLLVLLTTGAYGQNTDLLVGALEQIIETPAVKQLCQQYELSEPFPIVGLVPFQKNVGDRLERLEDKLRFVTIEKVFFEKVSHFRFRSLTQQDNRIIASFFVLGKAFTVVEEADLDPKQGVAVTMELIKGDRGWEVMAFNLGQ